MFRIRYNINDEKRNYEGLRHLISITQLQIFLALLLAVLIHITDPIIYKFYEPPWIKILDNSDYVTFLVTISGIGGVFIGLYYAAISTIGGSIYAKVPNNIRDLLAQDRVGNVYMNLLSFITFLGISLVSIRVLGYQQAYIAVPVMLILSGIGIISFVKLGQRAFYLFDPTELSHNLFNQLAQYIQFASAGGYQWDNPSFQNHAHNMASSQIDTLETLSDITKKEIHLRGGPFISLSKNLIRFLMFYDNQKMLIPSDSQWYQKKYIHKDWYRTEDTRVSIAHQTGTTLDPDIENNKEWVEDRVLPIIYDCIEINLVEERYSEILDLLEYVDSYLKRLSRSGRIRRAYKILDDIVQRSLDVISSLSEDEIIENEVLEKLAIVERLALIPINIALAYREYIEDVDTLDIGRKLSRIRWSKKADLYRHGFYPYSLQRIEWFSSRIYFEYSTDGVEITPLWYKKELMHQVDAEIFVDNTKSLVNEATLIYLSWIDKCVKSKHPWLSAAIMSREWEYWHKVDAQIEVWEQKWQDINSERNIEGLPWPEYDQDALREASNKRKSDLLESMSQQNLMLALLEKPEGFPDYAGQFLHASGETSFDALLTNNEGLLNKVFAMYLYGCVLRFDNLRPKSPSDDWRTQHDFKIAAAALLDLMELSGYAYLMSDYHGNQKLWDVVKTSWDDYLSKKDETEVLKLLGIVIAVTGVALEIPHRGTLRTNWKIKIERELSNVPRHEDYSSRSFISNTIIDHDSPLVRMFAREPYGSSFNGVDIFITYYIREKEGGVQLDLGRTRRDLKDSIEREVQNYSQGED